LTPAKEVPMAIGFSGYEIARSGLYVNERALNVTGHNISNVNTQGYVRQQVIGVANNFQNVNSVNGLWQFGTGASVQEVRQIRHMFIDEIYRRENMALGYWQARADTLSNVQIILSEPLEYGLQSAFNQFWDAWYELSKEPDSLTARALVRQRGEGLVHYINHMNTQLDKLQQDLNHEIQYRISEINEITKKIAELNVKIAKYESMGNKANDFRDQRNLLIDNLTRLIDCKVFEAKDGQVDITLGGYFIVSKGEHRNLVAAETEASGNFFVPKLEGSDIVVPINSGELKGLLESRGEVLGATGSVTNGTPDTKADIVIAVDVSGSDATYLQNVKDHVSKLAGELKKRGIDYNLKLVLYSGSVSFSKDFGMDAEALANAIPDTLEAAGSDNYGGPEGLLETLESISYREDAGRYALVFTPENFNDTSITADAFVERLNALGLETSIVTDAAYFTDMDGWAAIAGGSQGRLYDINTADFSLLMNNIASDLNSEINNDICFIGNTANIISSIKERLNALINITLREINYLHSSGMTLGNPPRQAEAFFTVIDDTRPLEMGNIKLNDNLSDLNNIAASFSGESGDNTLALEIASLRNKAILRDISGPLSIDEYYQAIILYVGNMGAEAARIAENQQILVNAADDQRQSIEGVSLDEEMANMMKYKFAYNASSRVLHMIDQMIQTIIERTGLAGR